ncbi:MAG TPA: CNNM domain-containing protein [Bacillota bacterium]|nr:CNNM domain-containing protein [Bacillota bacterium]
MSTQNSDVPRSEDERKRRDKNDKGKRRSQMTWAIRVFFISLSITAVLSLISGEMLEDVNMIAAFIVLIIFIAIGILFDILGLAVATAKDVKFHSMAARKNAVGKKAVWLLKNADRVSSFCNDVVGDISGVVSGATGTAISAKLFLEKPHGEWWTLLLTSVIAALIVGGKAACKRLAITKSESIVAVFARVLCVFSKK